MIDTELKPMKPAFPTLTFGHVSLTLQLLNEFRAQAKRSTGRAKRKYPHVTIDDSILIIENEHGGLMHSRGDLSFLMPGAPVLDKIFSRQLPADIQNGIKKDRRLFGIWICLILAI